MPYPFHRLRVIMTSQVREEVTGVARRVPGTVIASLGEPGLPTAPHILQLQAAPTHDDRRCAETAPAPTRRTPSTAETTLECR